VLLAPDTTWDPSTLHLVIARETALSGSIPLAVDHPYLFNFFGSHTLLGWGFLLAGPEGEVAGRTLLASLVGLGTALVCRRVGRATRPRVGLVCLALLIGTPLWLLQWGTAMIDIVVFTWSAAGLALQLRSPERRWHLLGMLCLAMGAASKHLGVLLPVALAGVWTLESLRSRRALPWRRALLLGCLCLAFATPWLWKNHQAYGKPFYLERGDADPQVMAAHRVVAGDSDTRRSPPVAEAAPLKRSGVSHPLAAVLSIASGDPWNGSMHPLLFCLLPIGVLLWRSRQGAGLALIALGSLAGFLASLPDVDNGSLTRYFFNLSPPFLLLAALGWEAFAAGGPRRARIAWILLAAATLPAVGLGALRSARRIPLLAGAVAPAQYWKVRDPAAPLIEEINDGFAAEERLYFVGDRVGLLRIPRRQLVRTYQAHWAGVRSAADLAAALEAWGITHVLVNDAPGEVWHGLRREWIVGPESALKAWRMAREDGAARLYLRRKGMPSASRSPGERSGPLTGRERETGGGRSWPRGKGPISPVETAESSLSEER
ncbi:MAG: ArnT family glycosyltransferase, partial [Planctomycetota bacterium]